jgi:hypothetical protein
MIKIQKITTIFLGAVAGGVAPNGIISIYGMTFKFRLKEKKEIK